MKNTTLVLMLCWILSPAFGCDDDKTQTNNVNNVNNVNNLNNTSNLNNLNNTSNLNNNTDPCVGVTCSGHGLCGSTDGLTPVCTCDDGFVNAGVGGLECIEPTDDCTGVTCSDHGACNVQPDGPVCVCEAGYTPSSNLGLDCVPVADVCIGGTINYDYNNDGTTDTWFDPIATECEMYELINRIRASHDDEGTPECHKPLMWNVEWSAHGRNHSIQMRDQGGLFHADYPYGQNCAYGCGPECEMDMYMNGANEGHCPPLSHHCNIMSCNFSQVGVGYDETWNTQNFL